MPEILKSVQKGILSGFGMLLCLCLLISILQLMTDLSDGLMTAISAMILGISSFTAAYISTQLCRSKGLIQGILCGTTMFLTTLFISVITNSFTFSDLTVIKAIFCLIAGAVGGVKGINTKKTNLPRRLH